MILLGIDPGAAHLGLALLSTEDAATPGAPVARVLLAETLPVDPSRLESAVAAILERIAVLPPGLLPARVAVEHGPWFARDGATTAGLVASQRSWTVCHDLVRDLTARSPIAVEVVARSTWAHRVVPHQRGGIRDSDVVAALPRLLDAASLAQLSDVHQRDAAGVGLGTLLAPAPRLPRAPRDAPRKDPPPPRKRSNAGRPASRNDAWLARRSAARDAARLERGCLRPPGKRGRCPLTCPCIQGRPGAPQHCRVCGEPKRGHVCPGPPPPAV